jgi:hypothetical protein
MTKVRVPLNAAPADQSKPGMSRLFNGQNLERYRKLASDVTTVTEREQVLQLLVKEMNGLRIKIGGPLPVARHRCVKSAKANLQSIWWV